MGLRYTTMKRLDYSNTLFIMLFSMLSIFAHAGELREWTSSKGSKMTAELVSKTDTHLTLKQASGKEITLAVKQLSDADQAYLRQLDEPASDKEQNKVDKEKKKAGLLPDYTMALERVTLPTLRVNTILPVSRLMPPWRYFSRRRERRVGY